MGELGAYTRAIQKGRSTAGSYAELRDLVAARRRKRWLSAKRRALELLRKGRSNEADHRRKRWLIAKQRAIRAIERR